MDAQQALISGVINTKDISTVLDRKISAKLFTDQEHHHVFTWIVEHWNNYGTVPDASSLKDRYPTYEIIATPEPIGFYVDKLREAYQYEKLHSAHVEMRNNLIRGEVKQTLVGLNKALVEISVESAPSEDINISTNGDERLKEYYSIGPEEIRGIPIGFPSIDAATGGLFGGQLITVVGPPKAGKSTFAILASIAAHEAGYAPLLLSFEMSAREQWTRHDAFRSHISHKRLVTNTLLPSERKRLEDTLGSLKDSAPFYISTDLSATSTVSGITNKVLQYKPDILIVDGTYLLDDEFGEPKNSSQALTNITRTLKRAAQNLDIPILNTTQVLTWKMNKRRGITMDAIGYTSSFAQDSDLILGALASEENDAFIEVSIVAGRNVEPLKIQVYRDWENGRFVEMEGTVVDNHVDPLNAD